MVVKHNSYILNKIKNYVVNVQQFVILWYCLEEILSASHFREEHH